MKRTTVVALCALLLLTLALLVHAALSTLSGDSFTASDTITNTNNALGVFDGSLATISSGLRSGDTQVWTIENFSQTGVVTAVQFAVRLNGSGFSNDNVTVQYSNDSGGTWFTAASVAPNTSLTIYGNYTVTASFPSNQSIANMQVRLLFVQNGGPDGPVMQYDGVEVYVTYTPPDLTLPLVALNRPVDASYAINRTVLFNITASDNVALQNCSLYINGSLNLTNFTPSNGGFTYINVTFGSDGLFLWNVTCFDTSNNSNTTLNNFQLFVDTTPPVVTNVIPANNSFTTLQIVNFTYNVTDLASITSCTLAVDNEGKQTNSSITKGVNQSFLQTLTNANHSWYINCTDVNGWTGQSQLWYVLVNSPIPVIVKDKSTYVQGETVTFTGQNWNAGANVSINTTRPDSVMYNHTALANNSGDINGTFFVNYSYPVGTYAVYAYQLNDSTINASNTFTVIALVTQLVTDKSTYVQGEIIQFTGYNFSPNTTVNLTINIPGGSFNRTNVSANESGMIAFNYTLNLTAPVGWYNTTGRDYNFSNLNASVNVSVTNRTPIITPNASNYSVNQTAGFLGSYYTPTGTILVTIYNTVTGLPGNSFPLTRVANASGTFNLSWTVNNTCSGNYTILGEDLNTTTLRANATFLISTRLNITYNASVRNVSGNLNATPSIGATNTSNDVYQDVEMSAANLTGYLQFGFFPGLPQNVTFKTINVTLEHHRTSNKVTNFQIGVVKNGVQTLATGTGCSGTPPDADTATVCNITGLVDNASVANALYILVNYTRSTGGGGDVQVDAVFVNYSWTGDAYGCFEFGNTPVPPTISTITSPGTIVLNAGTSKYIECNVTVSDSNGISDITGANATFYISPSVALSADTNVSHYSNTSCTEVAQGISSRDYVCGARLLYYAANGTWTCNATGISTDGVDNSTITFTVDPLFALNVTDTFLGFGNLTTGQTSSNVSENVTNVGNQRINISAYGYAANIGDGWGFACPNNNNLTVDIVRFSSVSAHTYAQKQNLTLSLIALNLTVPVQTGPGTVPRNASFWQVQLPSNVTFTGVCNGTIVFQAQADG